MINQNPGLLTSAMAEPLLVVLLTLLRPTCPGPTPAGDAPRSNPMAIVARPRR